MRRGRGFMVEMDADNKTGGTPGKQRGSAENAAEERDRNQLEW